MDGLFSVEMLKMSCMWVVSLSGVLLRFTKKASFAAFTCVFALGGAILGTIIGALKGQTTETGFVRGAGIGAVTGAITAIQLLDLMVDGESLSKVALFCSVMEGKVFMEWVGPAVLKAYQWQVSHLESIASFGEFSDIYDISEERGLSQSHVQSLPQCKFELNNMSESCDADSCSICLQEFKDGECGRRLPNCGHYFHLHCLDAWLIRQGSCPMCRDNLCNDIEDCFVDFGGLVLPNGNFY